MSGNIQEYVADRVIKYIDDTTEYIKDLEELWRQDHFSKCKMCNKYRRYIYKCSVCLSFESIRCVKCFTMCEGCGAMMCDRCKGVCKLCNTR